MQRLASLWAAVQGSEQICRQHQHMIASPLYAPICQPGGVGLPGHAGLCEGACRHPELAVLELALQKPIGPCLTCSSTLSLLTIAAPKT